MVKIELDVDLNELTDEELEAYLKLKKKGRAKKKTVIEEKVIEDVDMEDKIKIPIEQLSREDKERLGSLVENWIETSKESKRTFWTGAMISELYRLKEIRKVSLEDIASTLNRKFNQKLTVHQIDKKIDNMKYRRQWGTHLLEDTSTLDGAPHKKPIVDAADTKYRTVVKEKEVRVVRKNRTEKEWGDLFLDIRAHMKKKGCTFAESYKKVAGTKPHYQRYKKWCKEKNIDPMIRGKDFKPDKRRIPGYLEQRNEFLKWKNEQVAFIMKYHNMSMIEANRYLAGVWHKSKKNPFLANEFIKKQRDKVMIKPDKCLPELIHLNSTQLTILQGMVSNIISRPELTISYSMEGAMLGLEAYQDWVDFCKDFISKQDKIADCFGVGAKFSLIGTGRKGLAIKYKG